MNAPKTLQQAIVYFSDPDRALQYMIPIVWPAGIMCSHCACVDAHFIASRRIWRCRACKKQFSIKTGTVMEDSPLGLDKWLAAMWLIVNAKNGISSYEIHRALDITQKSAWFLLHRLRLAMQTGSFKKLSGNVEVDESYIGGLAYNMHKKKRIEKMKGLRGGHTKTAVVGLLERNSETKHSTVRTKMVPKARRKRLHNLIYKHVEPGSHIYTDAFRAYRQLSPEYFHDFVDHAESYVKDKVVHTNGLENFWSLLKRTLSGTYVACEPFHLEKYLDEQCFRFNNRKMTDAQRHAAALAMIAGKRMTYSELIGKMVSPTQGLPS